MVAPNAEVVVTGITLSTTRVRPGDLYVALPGSRVHGARFAAEAAAAGAVALLTDRAGAGMAGDRLPTLVVPDPRAVLGGLSALVYAHPGRSLNLIGITGTQGKTTTSRLAEGALLAAGIPAGVIGTLGTRIAGREIATSLTTPEAPDLQGLLARMVEDGVGTCVMEVSSHALALGRVDGCHFDVAVFLNLGRDHLDFHADLEDYYQVKASLFAPARAARGLVNIDHDAGRRLAGAAGIDISTLSMSAGADWRIGDIHADPSGSEFSLRGPSATVRTRCPIPGEYNVANAAAALAACAETGADLPALATGLAHGGGVPGRLQRIEAGQDFTVIVDYAHKPDAVRAALTTLRPLTDGRLILVLGAGGDRDPGKRPLMGAIAAELADLVLITDDNPRTEDPAAIRAAMLAGVPAERRGRVQEIADRREAIRAALDQADPGDIVIVAGKGHETGQEVSGVVHPFDDRTVVVEELSRR